MMWRLFANHTCDTSFFWKCETWVEVGIRNDWHATVIINNRNPMTVTYLLCQMAWSLSVWDDLLLQTNINASKLAKHSIQVQQAGVMKQTIPTVTWPQIRHIFQVDQGSLKVWRQMCGEISGVDKLINFKNISAHVCCGGAFQMSMSINMFFY